MVVRSESQNSGEVDINRTLSRIGYTGPRHVSVNVLTALQQAFLLTVPFENLDIHRGRTILLEPGSAERKIVEERRGDFCFESNGLFHRLLKTMGFQVRICSARMMLESVLSPDYDHMVLIVEIDGCQYLVDVGNGESVRTPLRLDRQEVSTTPEGKMYRIGEFDRRLALEIRETDEQEWQPRFVVNPTACKLEEFTDRCQFHQTSEESIFTRQPLVTLALPEGRATLTNRTLKITKGKTMVTEQELHDDVEYKA